MMRRTGVTRVPKGEDGCTLVISLAREKMNISVILPLIKYEVLRETKCLTDVSLLTGISMPSSVHIHCYATKCVSNAFPLMLFFQNLCQTIQSMGFFSVLMHSLREYKLQFPQDARKSKMKRGIKISALMAKLSVQGSRNSFVLSFQVSAAAKLILSISKMQ